jgi:hypothetical protein
MAEMIIPGTYIDVRAEGLISAGPIATGIVGILGTAASGPIGVPVTLSGYAAARDMFGAADDVLQPEDGANPLTLTRSLELLYGNGATSVVAVRVAGRTSASASFRVAGAADVTVAALTARTPGSWANNMQVVIEDAPDDARIRGEVHTSGFTRLRYAPVVDSAETQVRLQRGTTRVTRILQVVYKPLVRDELVKPTAGGKFMLGRTPVEAVPAINEVRVLDTADAVVRSYKDPRIVYGAGGPPAQNDIRVLTDTGEILFEASQLPTAAQKVVATYCAGHAAPASGQLLIAQWDGTLTFAAGEAPVEANGDRLIASYVVDRSASARVSLTAGSAVERYIVPDGRSLAAQINAASALATAAADAANGNKRPATGSGYFGTGSNVSGNNGADADADAYAAGLEALSNMLVNIVVLAGQNAAAAGDKLAAHLNSTAETDFERIGVIGAAGSRAADFLGHTMASDRIVLVAPGLKLANGTVLPPAYAAAAVAGLIAALPVQASLTNKPVTIPGLAVAFNRGEQQQLILRNVLTIVSKEGFRVLKSTTTAGLGTPFSNISVRRIVDYAKYGVRSAANSYLGRLNNVRVRGALKATLDAFLTRMVADEALTGYQLEVSATRAQEIAGEVNVVMTLQPTFSIDYIRVTMVLK